MVQVDTLASISLRKGVSIWRQSFSVQYLRKIEYVYYIKVLFYWILISVQQNLIGSYNGSLEHLIIVYTYSFFFSKIILLVDGGISR